MMTAEEARKISLERLNAIQRTRADAYLKQMEKAIKDAQANGQFCASIKLNFDEYTREGKNGKTKVIPSSTIVFVETDLVKLGYKVSYNAWEDDGEPMSTSGCHLVASWQ